jgi:hypothetical protein
VENFRQKHYPSRFPAFDGRKNLYSSGELPFGREVSLLYFRNKLYGIYQQHKCFLLHEFCMKSPVTLWLPYPSIETLLSIRTYDDKCTDEQKRYTSDSMLYNRRMIIFLSLINVGINSILEK